MSITIVNKPNVTIRNGGYKKRIMLHRPKLYGDLGIRTPRGVYYISTGPKVVDGPLRIDGDHIYQYRSKAQPTKGRVRFPDGSVRYLLDAPRPEATSFSFKVRVNGWTPISGRRLNSKSVTKLSGPNGYRFVFSIGTTSAGKLNFSTIFISGIPVDKRCPCRIKVQPQGMSSYNYYNMYSSWNPQTNTDTNYIFIPFETGQPAWPASGIKKTNIIFTITSDDEYLK